MLAPLPKTALKFHQPKVGTQPSLSRVFSGKGDVGATIVTVQTLKLKGELLP